MTPPWVREAVRACKLPAPSVYPRKMDKPWTLPVTVVKLSRLTPRLVQQWFSERQRHVGVPTLERELHGCMVARDGKGFLFYDATDPEHVQHFTLAHEIGHFVLDHLLPRARALKVLGDSILPVLNGRQAPTEEQALDAMLGRVRLDIQVRLMDRSEDGAITRGHIDASEYRADRIAFELLAPAEYVRPRLRGLARGEAVSVLESQFGLPRLKAHAYARLLLGPEHTGFSLRRYLGMEEDG